MATQQNVIINDDSENGLTKAIMLLYRAIRQRFLTRTNDRLSVSYNVVQSGVIDVQGKKNVNVGTNIGNAENHPQNVGYTENAEIKLPMLRKIQQDMKESFNKNLQEIKKVVVLLHPGGLFTNENEHAFMVLFGEDYDSFAYKFFHKLARIENQICSVKFHECDSKTYLTQLRKQCEAFLMNGNPKSLDSSMINYYLKVFQEYTPHDIKSSKVETNQCDEVKVKVNFDEIETKNFELEHQVVSLLKENEHLKLVYKNLFNSIKKSRVQTQKENLRTTLSEFAIDHILGKDDSSPSLITESNISKLEKELTTKFEAYFEKLENTKVVLERQLARKVDDSKAEKD
ncbi:hypothetical protein Tco_0704624 [Tanacetum coccineum]|uniref:Uncharacterized protein n=1 Tax=Tanacetum coccineum TaxID=301880 RepID=A0ABQ4Y3W3_9ASTR